MCFSTPGLGPWFLFAPLAPLLCCLISRGLDAALDNTSCGSDFTCALEKTHELMISHFPLLLFALGIV